MTPSLEPIPIELSRQGTKRLVELGEAQFPIVLSNEAQLPKRVVAGLIARAIGTSDAAVRLSYSERSVDLMILIRSLYEHVVTLAWITGDQAAALERLALLQRNDNEHRDKADREFEEILGRELLSNDARVLGKLAIKLAGNRRMPPLPDRARIADQEWGDRLGFTQDDRPLVSLRAAYTTTYRFGTTLAHPTLLGLNHVMDQTPTETVAFIEMGDRAAIALATVPSFLGLALTIGSDLLGRFRMAEINEVFETLAARLAEFRAAGSH